MPEGYSKFAFDQLMELVSNAQKGSKPISYVTGIPLEQALYASKFGDWIQPMYKLLDYDPVKIGIAKKAMDDFATGNYVVMTKPTVVPQDLVKEFNAWRSGDKGARTFIPFMSNQFGNGTLSSLIDNAANGNGFILTKSGSPFSQTIGFTFRGLHDAGKKGDPVFSLPNFETTTGSVFGTSEFTKDLYYTPMTTGPMGEQKIKVAGDFLKSIGAPSDYFELEIAPSLKVINGLVSLDAHGGSLHFYTGLDPLLILGLRPEDELEIRKKIEDAMLLETKYPGLFTGMLNHSFVIPSVRENAIKEVGFLPIIFDPGFRNEYKDIHGRVINRELYPHTSLPLRTQAKMYTTNGVMDKVIPGFVIRKPAELKYITTDNLGRSITGPNIGLIRNIIDASPQHKESWNSLKSYILGNGIRIFTKEFNNGGKINYTKMF